MSERMIRFGRDQSQPPSTIYFGIAPPVKPEEAGEILDYVLNDGSAYAATGYVSELELPDDVPPTHTEIVLEEFDGNPRDVLQAISIQLGKQGYDSKIDILPKPILLSIGVGLAIHMRDNALRQILPSD